MTVVASMKYPRQILQVMWLFSVFSFILLSIVILEQRRYLNHELQIKLMENKRKYEHKLERKLQSPNSIRHWHFIIKM